MELHSVKLQKHLTNYNSSGLTAPWWSINTQTVIKCICLAAIFNCPLAPPGQFLGGADVLTLLLFSSVCLAWDHGQWYIIWLFRKTVHIYLPSPFWVYHSPHILHIYIQGSLLQVILNRAQFWQNCAQHQQETKLCEKRRWVINSADGPEMGCGVA